jgi:hypothetical protein
VIARIEMTSSSGPSSTNDKPGGPGENRRAAVEGLSHCELSASQQQRGFRFSFATIPLTPTNNNLSAILLNVKSNTIVGPRVFAFLSGYFLH